MNCSAARALLNLVIFACIAGLSSSAAACSDTCEGCSECGCRFERRGDWQIAESPNFSIWSRLSAQETVQLAHHCETLRVNLSDYWLGETDSIEWNPKCVLVVHANTSEYGHVFGQHGSQPVGCTTVTCEAERVVFRRIDLRADALDWRENALPHELSHVLLADRFAGRLLPEWLNEGLAMMCESEELQQRRLDLLHLAHERNELPSLTELLKPSTIPSRLEPDTRYAISLSLVKHLGELGDRTQLLDFADAVVEDGCEAALLESYGIDGGISDLEEAWLDSLYAAMIPEPSDIATR